MSPSASLARTAGFAALYAAATLAGRLTVMDDTNLSLVWPAAGVGALWFCAQRRARSRWADVVALAGITVAVNMATGATAAMALVFVAANLAQVAMFLRLLARWQPQMWGAGGTAPLGSPRQLWSVLGAAFVSTAVGAAIGPTGMWLITGAYSWPATAVWMARNTASVLLIGAVGIRLGYLISQRPGRGPGRQSWWRLALAAWRRTPWWRIGEYAAVGVCSTAAYLIGFNYVQGLPLAFPLIAVTVWAAVRLSTTFVVLHDLYVGAVAVLFTLNHSGPFAAVPSHPAKALIAQLFVAIVAVVGLALALSRDERRVLVRELAAEKEEHAQQAQLMTAIVDAMADGLSVIDAHGRVVLRNPAAAQLLGGRTSPDDTLAGSAHYGLFHLDGTPMADYDMPYAKVMNGQDHHSTDLLIRNPGVPDGRIVEVTATALGGNPGARRAVVLFHDVTAERRHRDELTNFAGVVAHDLLNPLATIGGWTAVTAGSLDDVPAHPALHEARDGLVRIDRAAARMRGLITDLLAYTTARDAAIAPTHVDLDDLIADIATARVDAAAAGTTPVPRFDVGALPPIRADAVLARQLFDNLIGNAVKYTAPGVTPHIRIHARPTAIGLTQIDIADNGIGIPAGQHQAVFDNFHRAHRDAGYTGTGLGLAICKRIVERHGGTITAHPNPGGAGTCITLTMPTATTTQLTAAAV